MPRTGKGGKQQGASQTAYGNRSDLNNRGPEPITVAPGEPYGQRQMLEDAQRAVPVAGVQTPAPAPGAPQAATQAPQAAPQVAMPNPGEIPFLHPTERPDEPISTGMNPTVKNAGPLLDKTHANILSALEHATQSPAASPLVHMMYDIMQKAAS